MAQLSDDCSYHLQEKHTSQSRTDLQSFPTMSSSVVDKAKRGGLASPSRLSLVITYPTWWGYLHPT